MNLLVLKKHEWKYLIIDEAQRIKNINAKLSQVIRVYRSHNKLLLTGTPLQNNLQELWSLLNFLLPDLFESSEDWKKWFSIGDNGGEDVVEKLLKILRPFLLRRIKSEVEKGIPPKTETILYVKLSKMQRKWYIKVLKGDVKTSGGAKLRLLNTLMQLRKVCNHPYLFPGAEKEPFEEGDHIILNSGKILILDRLLKKIKEKGSRVLIFSQMTHMLDIIEDFLDYRGYSFYRIDGTTHHLDRQDQIEDFNKDDCQVFAFLLSTRSGGLGITLTGANVVVLFDSDFNPQMDLQAQDRAHRIGQKKPVQVYRLITEGTVEEIILERAERKLRLDAIVIQQGRLIDQNLKFSRNELLATLHFGADDIISSKNLEEYTEEDFDKMLENSEKKKQRIKK